MRWLCRLVTPPGGTVLDPFAGSGSTGKAARLEGFGFVGVEKEGDYLEIATARAQAELVTRPDMLERDEQADLFAKGGDAGDTQKPSGLSGRSGPPESEGGG